MFCVSCGQEIHASADDSAPEECDECAIPQTGAGSPLLERLVENLLTLREEACLDSRTLSERSGLHQQEVNQFERGKNEPRITTALRLVHAMEVSVDQLTDGILWYPGEVAERRTSKTLRRKAEADRLRGFFSIRGPDDADAPAVPGRTPQMAGDQIKDRATRLLAANLRRARKQAELSQQEVADRSRLHVHVVSRTEREEANPKLDQIVKLAGGLDMSLADLLIGIEWRPKGPCEQPRHNGRIYSYGQIERMWAEGKTAQEIADSLGATRATITSLINKLRDQGWSFPYRQPPPRPKDEAVRSRRPRVPRDRLDALVAWTEPSERDIGAKIGKNLREHRTRSGLSQSQFSEAAEVDRHYAARIERGRYAHLSLATVLKFSACAAVPVSALTAGISWDANSRHFRVVASA